MYTLNCKGKLRVIETPEAMGIINATPDSFYQGQPGTGIEGMVQRAAQMIEAGAAIIDIGGQSTRPGSSIVTPDEECRRVLPLIQAIQERFPGQLLSIDTYYSEVAGKAVEAGAGIVNDISAGALDKNMLSTVAGLRVPYIAMHMQGTPQTMQTDPHYTDVTTEILDYFIRKMDECRAAGIRDVIIDPGFGFGKTVDHNFTLLHQLGSFAILQCPLLVGLSRKSMIWKTLGTNAAGALNGTTALHTIALLNGAAILRVHDVKEAMETIRLVNRLKAAGNAETEMA